MKKYPRIYNYKKAPLGEYCFAFDKLDGSNIRIEWNKKKGFNKFGTRNKMILNSDSPFYDAIELFMNKYSNSLEEIFKDKYRNIDKINIYCEYLGEKSFAGFHEDDDIKDLILFDVDLSRKGFIPPKEFIKNFGNLHIPDIIYKGQLTEDFINDIEDNIFSLKEGVVCKGVINNKIWTSKIKTIEWLDKVKDKYGKERFEEELE